jgi:hypothetical protein
VVLLTDLATLGFQQKDRNARVVRFVEVVALVDRRLRRRRIAGNQRTGVVGGDVVEGRHEDIRDHRDQDPEDDDRNRQYPKQFREARALDGFGIALRFLSYCSGHAAVTVHATAAPS